MRSGSDSYGSKKPVGAEAPGVDHPLGDALVVEVEDLLAEVEVLEQRRAALARPSACSGRRRPAPPAGSSATDGSSRVWWVSPPRPDSVRPDCPEPTGPGSTGSWLRGPWWSGRRAWASWARPSCTPISDRQPSAPTEMPGAARSAREFGAVSGGDVEAVLLAAGAQTRQRRQVERVSRCTVDDGRITGARRRRQAEARAHVHQDRGRRPRLRRARVRIVDRRREIGPVGPGEEFGRAATEEVGRVERPR